MGDLEPLRKRLKIPDERTKLTWRGQPKFSDWTLTWGAGDDLRISVHRVVLAAGSRPAHFFEGACSGSFQTSSTDLSKLLPPGCRNVLEEALDFIYGEPLRSSVGMLPHLWAFADILQCPSLQTEVADHVAQASFCPGSSWQSLLEASLAAGQSTLSKVVVENIPSSSLARAAAKREGAGQSGGSCMEIFVKLCLEALASRSAGSPTDGWLLASGVQLDGNTIRQFGVPGVAAEAVWHAPTGVFRVVRREGHEWFTKKKEAAFGFLLVSPGGLQKMRDSTAALSGLNYMDMQQLDFFCPIHSGRPLHLRDIQKVSSLIVEFSFVTYEGSTRLAGKVKFGDSLSTSTLHMFRHFDLYPRPSDGWRLCVVLSSPAVTVTPLC
eukprot:TRINITY_DN121708_c0_g1_i1.p1 TRINITY_DN121708_c0_g1~~TRINITY_DN121708_c0_g1_i1.p1  ORF type:complete len:380 (-),score=26.88 TRINITY_DN121708_c0_g1_i1:54-1193(-)